MSEQVDSDLLDIYDDGTELQQLRSYLYKNIDEKEKIQSQLNESNCKITKLEVKNIELNSKLSQCENKIKELKTEIASLKQKENVYCELVESLKKENKLLKNQKTIETENVNENTTRYTEDTSLNQTKSRLSLNMENTVSVLNETIKDEPLDRTDDLQMESETSAINQNFNKKLNKNLNKTLNNKPVVPLKVNISMKSGNKLSLQFSGSSTTKNGNLLCPLCPFIGKSSSLIRQHFTRQHICITTSQEKKKAIFRCHICNQMFTNMNDLPKHLKLHETKKDSIVCEHCNCQYKDAKALMQHMSQIGNTHKLKKNESSISNNNSKVQK